MRLAVLVLLLFAVLAAPAAADPTCGGETPPDGQWVCTFDDEFDVPGPPDPMAWAPQLSASSTFSSGPAGARACYVDDPRNIAVSGGVLNLTVRREPLAFRCGRRYTTRYTAGMVSTYHHFDQTYGRFEVRARVPQASVPGLQETLWLYPTTLTYGPWPASGEIDFAEFYSRHAGTVVPYVHYNTAPSDPEPTATCPIDPTAYNDYAVVWEPGVMTVTVNGAVCMVVHAASPFDQPFFVALTQALGVGANAFNARVTPLPATTSIDYVRVWAAQAPPVVQPVRITHVSQAAPRWRTRTTFRFTLSRAATVTLVFRHGRHVVGRIAGIRGRRGRNAVIFRGRLRHGRRLKPGRYSVAITAPGARARRLRFAITGP